MKAKDIKTWLKNLRSGEYEQGTGNLCTTEVGVDRFCCLGVACDVLLNDTWTEGNHPHDWSIGPLVWHDDIEFGGGVNSTSCMPGPKHLKKMGLDSETAANLATMNDNGADFKEIAEWIEKNLEGEM